jgi:hypothetical protein
MTEVFELTYHGGGGFTYTEVWNMDVPKRKFNLKKINEHLEKIQNIRDEQNQKITEKTDTNKLKIPDFIKTPSEDNTFVSRVKPRS